jgi:hypothetical protein
MSTTATWRYAAEAMTRSQRRRLTRSRAARELSSAVGAAEDVLRSAIAAAVVRVLLRGSLPEVPLPTLLETLTPHRRPAQHRHIPRATRWAVHGVDVVAARTLGPSTCLFRALAHYAALRQARVEARFVMGIASDAEADGGGSFVGHAWIEVDGEAVWEQAPPRYRETFCYPARVP